MENEWRYKELETREQKIHKDIELYNAAQMYYVSMIQTGVRSTSFIMENCEKWKEAKNATDRAYAELAKIKDERSTKAHEYLKRKQDDESISNKKQREDNDSGDESDGPLYIQCTNDSESCIEGVRGECAKCGKNICELCYESGYEHQPDSTEVDEVYCNECFKKWTFYTVLRTKRVKACEGVRFAITRNFIIPSEWDQSHGEFIIMVDKCKYLILSTTNNTTLRTRLDLMTPELRKNFIANGMEWLDDGNTNVLNGFSGRFSLHGWDISKNQWDLK